MPFFNSRKTEQEEQTHSSKSSYAPEGMQRISVNLMDETYKKVQFKKIELGKSATDIIEECLALGMDALEPKDRMTAEKHKSLMDDIAKSQSPQEPTLSYTIEDSKPVKPKSVLSNKAKPSYVIETDFAAPRTFSSKPSSLRQLMRPVVKKMKSGDSILVNTMAERQRFTDLAKSMKKKPSTRKLSDGDAITFRCWIV
jgi:hypothetical protein